MAECNSVDSTECNSVDSIVCNPNETSNLNNQQFTINKINEIKNYFIAEIKKRELMSKKLSKYILLFLIISTSLYLFHKQQVVTFLLHHLQQVLEHL